MSRAFQLKRLAHREFYRCPNEPKRVQILGENDNKVMCGCGKTNPAAGIIEPTTGGEVHHAASILSPATVDEYLDWMEKKYLKNR